MRLSDRSFLTRDATVATLEVPVPHADPEAYLGVSKNQRP